MTDIHPAHPLPAARALGRAQQRRVLLIAAASIVVLLLAGRAWHWIAPPSDTPAAALPAGTFQATPEQLAQMKVETVGDGIAGSHVDATGTISVDEDHSTPVLLPYSGQVAEVFVQAGQHVVRGQPLLKIASPDFVEARNTLAATAAARATAAAQLKIATDNAARQQAIYQTAGGALKDYRQAQSDAVTAQSALRSTDAALTAARDKLALFGKDPDEVGRLQAGGGAASSTKTLYRSPVSGVVATRDVAPGQYVGAGGDKPVMTIADFGHVWLIAQLPEGDAASVHVGDPVEVTTPAYPGRTFHAVIDNVAAALDPATHRLPVRATVANPGEALKPQMFASFQIARAAAPGAALLVPAAAVIHEGDTARVWVLGPNRLLHAQTVTIAGDSEGMEAIAGGLRRGDRIVTAGALFVNEAGSGQ